MLVINSKYRLKKQLGGIVPQASGAVPQAHGGRNCVLCVVGKHATGSGPQQWITVRDSKKKNIFFSYYLTFFQKCVNQLKHENLSVLSPLSSCQYHPFIPPSQATNSACNKSHCSLKDALLLVHVVPTPIIWLVKFWRVTR